MRFSKLDWPVCPHCGTTINNPDIISLTDLGSPNGQLKVCPMKDCGKKFVMWTVTTLTATTGKAE